MTTRNRPADYQRKVHAPGPILGSGNFRTLCEKLLVTGPFASPHVALGRGDEVTCRDCRQRLARFS